MRLLLSSSGWESCTYILAKIHSAPARCAQQGSDRGVSQLNRFDGNVVRARMQLENTPRKQKYLPIDLKLHPNGRILLAKLPNTWHKGNHAVLWLCTARILPLLAVLSTSRDVFQGLLIKRPYAPAAGFIFEMQALLGEWWALVNECRTAAADLEKSDLSKCQRPAGQASQVEAQHIGKSLLDDVEQDAFLPG